MSRIVVNSSDLRSASDRLRRLRSDAYNAYNSMQRIYLAHSIVASDLHSAVKFEDLNKLDRIVQALEYVAGEFESAESDIQRYQYGLDSSRSAPIWFHSNDIHTDITSKPNKLSVKTTGSEYTSPDGHVQTDYFEAELAAKLNVGKYKDSWKKSGDDEEYHSDPRTADGKDSNPWDKKTATILEVESTASIETDALYVHAEGDNGSAYVKVGKAEAHSSVSAGFYVYEVDENGNTKKIFRPGVQAEVGASISLLEAHAEGKLGDDNFNLHGETTVKAGTVEGKASVSVTPNDVHVKLSAEANLASIEGKAGVTILGAEANVTGSLKVGIGAHADVGYHDGKFKLDIGAAVGVGFDIGFEINVSGAVNAVADVGKSIANTGKKIANGIGKLFRW